MDKLKYNRHFKNVIIVLLIFTILIFSACKQPDEQTKNEEYKLAVKSFDDFLCGKISASYAETDGNVSEFYIYDFDTNHEVSKFTLYDVTGDSIPELHTRSLFHDIFCYKDGKVIHLFRSKTNLMNGSVKLLENGALFSEQTSIGVFYNYTTFTDGVTATISFDYLEDYSYNFNEEKVSKEIWLEQSRDILALSEKQAKTEWHEYE